MYKKVDPGMNFVEREKETLKFWKITAFLKKPTKKPKENPCFLSTTVHPPLTESLI